jgi:hypothetical protein
MFEYLLCIIIFTSEWHKERGRMAEEKQILTRPINEYEKVLRTKFYTCVAEQNELMDKVSEHLLTIELAIPGAYAAILKMIHGDDATLSLNWAFYVTFIAWFIALVLTLFAILPKKWKVDREILKQDPQKMDQSLGIEDFFEKSSDRKFWLIIASTLSFFVGVIAAVFTMG